MNRGCLSGKILATCIVFLVIVPVGCDQTLSEKARRYMIRGQAVAEKAKRPADYEEAIRKFEQAAKLAPDWPEIYYNLGVVQEKVKLYGEAIGNLKRYLALAPDATDADAVRNLIYKIEFLKERGWSKEDLVGTWVGPREVGNLTIGPRKPDDIPLITIWGEFVLTTSNVRYSEWGPEIYIDRAEFDGKRLQIGLRYFRHDAIDQVNEVRYESYELTMVSRGRMTGTVKVTKTEYRLNKRGEFIDAKNWPVRRSTYTGEWLRK